MRGYTEGVCLEKNPAEKASVCRVVWPGASRTALVCCQGRSHINGHAYVPLWAIEGILTGNIKVTFPCHVALTPSLCVRCFAHIISFNLCVHSFYTRGI